MKAMRPNNLVQVQRRDSYGLVRVYPVNQLALIFALLLKRRTFSPEDLSHIERLGFELEWVPQDIPLGDDTDNNDE